VARKRLDTKQAAQILGISSDAVHKRAKRGVLESEKGSDGRVYVWIDVLDEDLDNLDDGPDNFYAGDNHEHVEDARGDRNSLVESMQDQIEYLRLQLDKEREANRENRRLLAAALERIPAIEAPPDTPPQEPSRGERESPVTASEERGNGDAEEKHKKRSWWQRLFG
jgi:hypothetical protein